jgi:hypothetical protein
MQGCTLSYINATGVLKISHLAIFTDVDSKLQLWKEDKLIQNYKKISYRS